MNFQILFNSSAGIAGAFLSFAYGSWHESLTFLLIAISVDIITGLYASIKEGRGLNSAVGAVGLAKKWPHAASRFTGSSNRCSS
ncbi:phage holin family protein [Paenibacillus gorillae]|uniref:phage holin family protein n=1 Tax=Paenibacillus gorillae TaxID=1243662 RepID=UPI0004BC8961